MEHCAPHTRGVHKAMCLEREVAGRENLYQLLELLPGGFHMLWSKAHYHLLLRAYLHDSKKKLPPTACQAQLGVPSVVCSLRGMQFPGIMYTCNRVLCQVLEPIAFLVHPVLTAFAEDAVAAHSSATDSTWELA